MLSCKGLHYDMMYRQCPAHTALGCCVISCLSHRLTCSENVVCRSLSIFDFLLGQLHIQ